MKYRFFVGFLVFAVLLAGCEGDSLNSSQRPDLPVLPEGWNEILGEPHWRLEWLGQDGAWMECYLSPGEEIPAISLIQEWATPVLAWPFWPGWDLIPEIMRPAGALFPWDAAGDRLELSWRGGAEAVFWKEMAAAKTEDVPDSRLPWLFDWPRFREILEGDEIPEAVSEDFWLVDWKDLAKRTVQSGFDRRRIKSMKLTEVEIPNLEGFWAGSSPFATPIEAPPGGPLCLEVAATVGTWVSANAVLKCSIDGWVIRGK
jgi:hypothetical protein